MKQRSRQQQPTTARCDRHGGPISNRPINTTTGTFTPDTEQRRLNRMIGAAVDEQGLVTVIDSDGVEVKLYPVDARTRILKCSAALK